MATLKLDFKDYKLGFVVISAIVAIAGIPLIFHDAMLGCAMIIEGLLLTLFYFYFAPQNSHKMLALPCFFMAFYQLYAAFMIRRLSLLVFFMIFEAAALVMTGLLASAKLYSLKSIAGIITQVLMLGMIALGIWWFIDGAWVLANTNYKLSSFLIYYIPYTLMLILPNAMNLVYVRCFIDFKNSGK